MSEKPFENAVCKICETPLSWYHAQHTPKISLTFPQGTTETRHRRLKRKFWMRRHTKNASPLSSLAPGRLHSTHINVRQRLTSQPDLLKILWNSYTNKFPCHSLIRPDRPLRSGNVQQQKIARVQTASNFLHMRFASGSLLPSSWADTSSETSLAIVPHGCPAPNRPDHVARP